jgi:chorismate synthase
LGSEHNDAFVVKGRKARKDRNDHKDELMVVTKTNHSGGVQGGISNGMPIVFRTVFKPVATIFQPQQTVTKEGKKTTLTMYGRHDPCVVPRAVVIVEAMAAIVLVDALLRQRAAV